LKSILSTKRSGAKTRRYGGRGKKQFYSSIHGQYARTLAAPGQWSYSSVPQSNVTEEGIARQVGQCTNTKIDMEVTVAQSCHVLDLVVSAGGEGKDMS